MKTYLADDVLTLERRPVAVDPLAEYQEIGIRSFGRGIFHKDPVLGADLGNKRVFWIQPGDLIFNNVFAWEGAVALAREDERGKIGSHRFMTYVVDSDVADSNYLRHFFSSQPGLALLQHASPGSAGRNRTLAIDRFADLKIPLPDLGIQRSVASKLDRLSYFSADLSRRADRAAHLASSLRWAFVRRAFEELSNSHGEVALPEYVDINPESVSPRSAFSGRSFVYVDIGAVDKGTGRIIGAESMPADDAPSRARRRIRRGDVIVSTVRPNLRGSAMVPEELDGQVCSTGFAVLRPKSGLDSAFLAWQVLSDTFVDQLVDSTRGGHYPAVPDRQLIEVRIVVPADVGVQTEVAAKLDGAMTMLDKTGERQHHARQLLDALRVSVLNSAFEGNL